MPNEIDQALLDKSKSLDIAKPPMKQMEHKAFPKMVYKHPKDKAKEHKFKVVQDEAELKEALAAGWNVKPHVPVVVEAADPDDEQDDAPVAKPEKAEKPKKDAPVAK